MDETKTPAELEGLALSIIDDNRFMTLATADAELDAAKSMCRRGHTGPPGHGADNLVVDAVTHRT